MTKIGGYTGAMSELVQFIKLFFYQVKILPQYSKTGFSFIKCTKLSENLDDRIKKIKISYYKFFTMRTSKYSLYTESAKRIQAWWRGELQRGHYRKLLKQKNVKRHIAHELLSSEEAYVEDLCFLVSKVQKSAVDIIPADDYRLLFSTIGEIYKFHHGFLEELRSELK